MQPIKRSKQLAPFSREHHDALVFLLRIKQGLKNGTGTTVISEYVKWFWDNNLKKHFDEEEALLLPHLDTADKLATQLKNEHRAIRKLVAKELAVSEIALFSELLNAHIRFEERTFFPYVEKVISIDHLNDIFSKLDRPVECQPWKHAFWAAK